MFQILAPICAAMIYLVGVGIGSPDAILVAYAAAYLPLGAFTYKLYKKTNERLQIGTHLFGIVIAQVFLLLGDPVLSEDIWRYVWDGFQVGLGNNPYCLPPSDASLDDFAAAQKLDDVRRLIGHSQHPTIYPPAAQAIFSISSIFEPSSLPIRMSGICASLGSVYFLARTLERLKITPSYVCLMSIHPLFLVETAVMGHVDVFGIFFLTLSFYAAAMSWEKRGLVFIGLAALTKLIPILVVPVLFRLRIRAILAVGLIMVIGYAYFYSTACSPLGSLPTFSGKWQHNAGVVALFEWSLNQLLNLTSIEITVPKAISEWLVGEPEVSGNKNIALFGAKTLGYLMFLIGFAFIYRSAYSLIEKALLVLAALFLCVPVVHPWYLLWLLPGLPFLWNRGGFMYAMPLLWWSWSVLAAYVARIEFLNHGTWTPATWLTGIEYIVLCLLMLLAYVRRQSPPSTHQ